MTKAEALKQIKIDALRMKKLSMIVAFVTDDNTYSKEDMKALARLVALAKKGAAK